MKRFIEGENRSQSTLFPEALDDYIAEDNPVRVVDAFVTALDFKSLGFKRIEPSVTGAPAYHPAALLKIYVYGYLNRIQSSRCLEKETQRNVEMMWLTERLTPSFKTIADFRKDNSKGIINVCREFVGICRKLNLFANTIVAIDGSKFKAVNSGDKNFTPVRMKLRTERVEKHIARYLAELEEADQATPPPSKDNTDKLKKKLAKMQREMQRLNIIDGDMMNHPDKQISLTDPDARSMASTRRNSGAVCYNVQTAVDTTHHLIVAHEVTNRVTDRKELFNMSKLARTEMGSKDLTVLADRGYFSSLQILACQREGIEVYVPKTLTSGSKAAGRFGKPDFNYEPEHNQYRCPAGKAMKWRFTIEEAGKTMHKYWSSNCPTCKIKEQCTTGKNRRITRWEHEDIIDAMEAELEKEPNKMGVRRQTVEHPYGTLKHWMGSTHFLTKRFKGVRAEMSLHVLAYNLKRVMKIIGIKPLMEAVKA